jgi:hypothetical protein
MPLMSNVGRHGSSHLSSKRRSISHCLRFAPAPALARAVRPLAAGEPVQRFHQVHVAARSGCPSCGGQRTARSVQATRSRANVRPFAASQNQACLCVASQAGHTASRFSARCRSQASPSKSQAMQVVSSSRAGVKAHLLRGAAVPFFVACRPTPPSSGQPSAAAHVER